MKNNFARNGFLARYLGGFYVLWQKKEQNKFGWYRKTDYFCTRFKREAQYNMQNKLQKNNQTFFQKHLVGKIKSLTFAPTLREKLSTKRNK